MDNLRKTIKLFFEGLDPDKVLGKRTYNKSKELFGIEYAEQQDTFKTLAYGWAAFDQQSTDEINNLHQKIEEDWGYNPFSTKRERISPFNLLNHFTKVTLTELESEPFVNYEHLLKWRDLSLRLGEDLFTSSYLAQRDVLARKDRYYFSWRPILFSDNRRLHSLLQKGVAENHSHLWASSLTFDISWMALMNDYANLKPEVEALSKKHSLFGRTSHQFNADKVEFKLLIEKAVALRLILYLSMEFIKNIKDGKPNDPPTIREFINKKIGGAFSVEMLNASSNTIDSNELVMNMDVLLRKIEELKELNALKLPYDGSFKAFDYAVPKNMVPDNIHGCYFLYGERKIFYYLFRMIYTDAVSKDDKQFLETIFLAYLNIKGIFRREIVQLNDRYGFGNFKDYQDRKFQFIPQKTIYETIFLDITLNFNRKLMNIISNEYRIGPEESSEKLKENIERILRTRQYDESELDWEKQFLNRSDLAKYVFEEEIRKTYTGDELHFVLHFFKRKDKNFQQKGKESSIKTIKQGNQCRDYELRKQVFTHAIAIRGVREQYPKIAQYIRGIDAASSEVDARPEVFGQAFRFLKNHQTRDEDHNIKRYLFDVDKDHSDRLRPSYANNQLRITFHAGEDFFDVVDGMRYIDECMKYLGMTHGDRFGHALAIGIDVKNYYTLKENKIMLSKHTLLDNVAWLLSKVRKFGLTHHLNEVYRLENIFKNLYSNIYLSNVTGEGNEIIRHVHYQQFYDAWKLRGDDPTLYDEYFNEKQKKKSATSDEHFDFKKFMENKHNITYWERCRLNDCQISLENLRNRDEIARLYFEYHYNAGVKNTGNEIKQFEITSGYTSLVEDVQKCMMQYVMKRNFSIETNPTSNFLIGPIQKYIEHPIIRWFNLGLETDWKKIEESPQISVSINTDDAGVFSTTMENEYALMAIALEKEKDEHGQPKYKPAMIYDWLDRIREMGIQQSFNDRKRIIE